MQSLHHDEMNDYEDNGSCKWIMKAIQVISSEKHEQNDNNITHSAIP